MTDGQTCAKCGQPTWRDESRDVRVDGVWERWCDECWEASIRLKAAARRAGEPA